MWPLPGRSSSRSSSTSAATPTSRRCASPSSSARATRRRTASARSGSCSSVGPPLREEVLTYEPGQPLLLQAALGGAAARPRRHGRAEPGGSRDQDDLRDPHDADDPAGRRRRRRGRQAGGQAAPRRRSPPRPSAAPRFRRMAEGGPKARRLTKAWTGARKRLSEAGKLLRDPKRLWKEHKRLVIAVGAAAVLAFAGGVLAYESLRRPGRRPQPRRRLQTRKTEAADQEDGPLAVLRLRPGPHPVPAGEGGEAALPGTLALHRRPAARVPARGRRRQALLRQQQRLRDRARRRHRQGALEAADRRTQRLLARLQPRAALHRQPRPRAHRQARRENRADALEARPAGPRPSPRRWSSAAPSTSAARTATSTRSAPATATCAGRPRWAARSSRRRPTTAARSTSATTAAT